jgi:hypothetical protein
MFRYLIFSASLLLVWASATEAQVVSGLKASTAFTAHFQSWELKTGTDTVRLGQWAFPISFFLPLRDNYELTIVTSAASTSLDNARSESSLDGFSDTKIQLAGSFSHDRYLLSLGVNLPSGKKSLDREEVEIAQLLSLDFLNYPVKSLGEGFNLNVSLARAFKWNNTFWGLGAGYQYSGEYQPYHDLPDYKPGDRVHLTGGVILNVEKIKLSGELTYLMYQADQAAGEKIFRDGSQLDAKGAFFSDQKRYSLAIRARFIIRDKDERYAAGRVYPGEVKNHGDDFRFFTSFSLKTGAGINLIAQAEAKLIGENDYQPPDPLYLGASRIIGAGGGIDWELRGGHYLAVRLKKFQGQADGDNLDLSGLQIQGSLLMRF